MLSISMGFSLSTWQTSTHANSSINFSYSGFDDPLLDFTAPIYFELKYLNSSAEPIANATGACALNYSAPTSEIIAMNFSGNGTYWANLNFNNETLGNVFQVACTDSSNSSNDHSFSDGQGVVSFQYDLFNPIIVDVLNANETGPTEGTISSFIAGQSTILYALVRNITGNGTPINITDSNCNVSLQGGNKTASFMSFEDYYSARFALPASGSLTAEATCLVDFTTYTSQPENLSVRPLLITSNLLLGGTSTFKQSILLTANRTDSYLATSSNEGGALPAIQVRQLSPAHSLLLNVSYGTYIGRLGFLDLNNSGDLSLIYAGSAVTQQNIFSSAGDSFSHEQPLPSFQNYDLPSVVASDLFGAGFTDLLISGLKSGVRNTSLLTNNGSDISNVYSSLPDLRDASICYGDFNYDHYYDLFVSGQNSSGIETGFYFNNGSDFILNQTLPTQLYKSTCSIGRFLSDNQTSLLHFGTNDTGDPDNPANWNYVIYNDTRNWSHTTSGLLEGFNGSIYGDAVIADFSGDGLSDIFICGGTSGNEVLTLYVNDLNNSGSFVAVNPFNLSYTLPECSLSAADYDFDGDLDLAYTGVASGQPIQLFNNTVSQNSANTVPQPPAAISGSWNESTGDLWINWSAGSDDETPVGMLSYNLEVESPSKGLLLSGQPAVTSNPSQGYLGNMQYRLNTTLRNQTPENVIIRIQTIDSGLRRSAWQESSAIIEACNSKLLWNISAPSGCAISDNLSNNSVVTLLNGSSATFTSGIHIGANTSIHIRNGTVDLSDLMLTGTNASIVVYDDSELTLSNTQLSGIYLTTYTPLTISDSQLDHFQGHANATFINTSWVTLTTNASVDIRYYLAPAYTDQFNNSLSDVSIFNGSYSISNLSRINLTAYVLNATANTSRMHNLTFSKAGYYNTTDSFTLTDNSAPVIMLFKDPAPVTAGFNISGLPAGSGDNYSSDLEAYSTVSGFSIEKSGAGEIIFGEPVNLSFINLNESVAIEPRSIFINSTQSPGLDRSAQLIFSNLTFTTQPTVLRNGALCDTCSNISYNGSSLNVTITGFSNYSLINNSQIGLLTPSVIFNATATEFAVSYHAYGNTSVDISGASCSVTIGSNTSMLSDSGMNHTTNLLFNETDTLNATVYCLGNNSYEPLNQSYVLSIVRNGAYFLKAEELTGLTFSSAIFGNLSGTNRFWATGSADISGSTYAEQSFPAGINSGNPYAYGKTAISDLNNDGWSDLISMGSSGSGFIFQWMDNLSTIHSFVPVLSGGDFKLFNFEADGDTDLIACGINASNDPVTVILRNQRADQDYQNETAFIGSTYDLPQLSDCSIAINQPWLVLGGKDAENDDVLTIYRFNESNFTAVQNLSTWRFPDVELLLDDLDEDNLVDLIVTGQRNSIKNTSFFQGNDSGFTLNQTLSEQLVNLDRFGPALALGRLNNETNHSLLMTGISENGTQLKSYGYNGSDYIEQDIALDVTPIYRGSLSLGDIDNDSDLDLLITGQSDSGPITQVYTNTLAQYAGADIPPTAPAALTANYSNGSLLLNWSAGADTKTPNASLMYSLRIGNISNPHHFISGVPSNSATGQQTGNIGRSRSATLSLPDACFSIQVQTIDAAYQTGNWSSVYTANNHSEICNGYDNDCDGLTDEDFIYPGTDLFTYNGTINSTNFTCTFYEMYAPQRLSCPNNPENAPGDACNTATYTGAVYAWNTTTKTCDCDLSSASLKNVQVNTDRSTGGSGSYVDDAPDPVTEEAEPETETAPPSPVTSSGTSSPKPKSHFTTELPGFELITTLSYAEDKTIIDTLVRNIERTTKHDIRLLVDLSELPASNREQLRSVNDVKLSDKGQLLTTLGDLDYLETTTLLYSVPGYYSASEWERFSMDIEAEDALDQKERLKTESDRKQKADTSIVANVSESVKDNQTVIRLDIDLKDNISQVHGVEIEQEIPKCLIEEITDSILESAIDPALLQHVEIKRADPLLVWRFDRLEDAVNLELTLDALRSADCEDEVSLELLAKSFIFQNQPINKTSVFIVLLISFGLMGLIFSPVWLASRHRFHRHNNPHIVRLAKIILHEQHKGRSKSSIQTSLIHNDESEADITAAFAHLEEHNPSRHGLLVYEHRVEIVLFIAVLALSIMELGGLLPGYLDWFKKVLSWAIMLMVVHHANLSRLFLNQEAPRFSVTLMTGFFLMHLVRLAEFASNGLEESVGFVFDWYVVLVRLDAQIHLSWILFTIGLILVAGCAIYAAFALPVRERSLCSVFFRTPDANSHTKRFGHIFGLLAVFTVFFFSVFNRLIEWLAIAVDSALFVLAAIILMALSLSMIAHHHGHRSRHHWEKLGELLADDYLIGLELVLGVLALIRPFIPVLWSNLILYGTVTSLVLTLIFIILRLKKLHEMSELEKVPLALDHLYEKFIRLLRYPRTLVLALSGLLVLQLVVESALYIIPNITGQASHLYGSHSGDTLLSLFGNTGMVSQQLFNLSAPEALIHALVYITSFMGLLCLLFIPVWIWVLSFRHRGHGVASGSIVTWMNRHSNWTQRLGRMLMVGGLPLGTVYLLYPVLAVESLFGEGSAGVRFIPHLLHIAFAEGVIIVSACFIAMGVIYLLSRLRVTTRLIPFVVSGASIILLVHLYFIPFIHSLWLEAWTLLSSSPGGWISVFSFLLGLLQVADMIVVYGLGGASLAFLLLPQSMKKLLIQKLHSLHPFIRIFELAENEHLLEYYDEARVRFAGNLVRHLEHYMRRCTEHKIPRSNQIKLMREHGYPRALILRASKQLTQERKQDL